MPQEVATAARVSLPVIRGPSLPGVIIHKGDVDVHAFFQHAPDDPILDASTKAGTAAK